MQPFAQTSSQPEGTDMGKLDGKRVAIIATDGFEEVELLSPREALLDEGAHVEVLSPAEGAIRGWKNRDWSNSIDVDRDVSQALAEEYDALVLPGGVINADHLRLNEDVVRLVSEFFSAGKPVAAICHAPWTLIEADVVHGRHMTSYHTLKTDLLNAGADWVDESAVQDENLLTSRAPADLPEFNAQMVDLFATWLPEEQVERQAGRAAARRSAYPEAEGEPVAGVEPLPLDFARTLPKRTTKKPTLVPPPAGRGTTRRYASRRPSGKRSKRH
jgi:protease I